MQFYCLFAEAEAWFIDSFEAWRKARKLENFILLGHSFGGYVAAKYALKVRNSRKTHNIHIDLAILHKHWGSFFIPRLCSFLSTLSMYNI